MDEFKLSDWWIVITNGVWFVGAKKSSHVLSPVYQLHTTLLEVGGGGVQQPIKLLPFLCMGLKSLSVPDGAIWLGLENFSFNRREWEAQIRQCQRMDEKLRASALGLETAH